MEVSGQQCAVIAQTIPILFVLFIAERAIDRTVIPYPLNWLLVAGAFWLMSAETLAFRGIDGGLTGHRGGIVVFGTIIVLAIMFTTLAVQIIRKPPSN